MLKIKIIVGSTRRNRFSEKPAAWIYEKAKNNEIARKWAAKINEADAFIIVTPEYNHGTSGVLKNALDYIYYEWNNKSVGFVSYGGVGGARAVEQLRGVAIELQMAPIRNAVHIPQHWNLLDENGSMKDGALDPFKGSATIFLDQLLWWARALKIAREQQLEK